MRKKIVLGLSTVGAIATPFLSFAQQYSTTTANNHITSTASDIGYLVAASITVSLVGGVALLGLGFAWRHLKKYITGRKF